MDAGDQRAAHRRQIAQSARRRGAMRPVAAAAGSPASVIVVVVLFCCQVQGKRGDGVERPAAASCRVRADSLRDLARSDTHEALSSQKGSHRFSIAFQRTANNALTPKSTKHIKTEHPIGAELKKDARDIILEFIRSRPPLKSVSLRCLGRSKASMNTCESLSMHERLMLSIRSYSSPLRKTPLPERPKHTATLSSTIDASGSSSNDTNSSASSNNNNNNTVRRLIPADKKLVSHLGSSSSSSSSSDDVSRLASLFFILCISQKFLLKYNIVYNNHKLTPNCSF